MNKKGFIEEINWIAFAMAIGGALIGLLVLKFAGFGISDEEFQVKLWVKFATPVLCFIASYFIALKFLDD